MSSTVDRRRPVSSRADVLSFLLIAGVALALPPAGQHILVRLPIEFPFLNKPWLDEYVDIRIQADVMHLFFIILLEILFDGQSMRLVQLCNNVQ